MENEKNAYIVSQLDKHKCDGGCGTVFYFSYDDCSERRYSRDNLVASWPAKKGYKEPEIDGDHECCDNCEVLCSDCECKNS